MSKPGETDYGKGSFSRTTDIEMFRGNFDAIDWSKPEWPDVIGVGPQLAPCEDAECPYHGRHETKLSSGHCALKRVADVNGSPKHEQQTNPTQEN